MSFVCRECGNVQPKWMGKCPDCGAWDALERFAEGPARAEPGGLAHGGGSAGGEAGAPSDGGRRGGRGGGGAARRAQALAEVKPLDVPRVPTGVRELDRVLGGGFVPGSVVLIGGDPGIGKSTLLLQSAAALARAGHTVLYTSSEESAPQIKLRADRLADASDESLGRNLLLLADGNIAVLVEEARRVRPALLVVDSIQLVYRGDLDAAPGSVAQLRRCCLDLVAHAKTTGAAVAIVGHVTKEGDLAGPKLLEHLVDVVLAFEGDRHHAYRLVRAAKNRFGSTQEVGLFEMTGAGLAEVEEVVLAPDAGRDAPRRPGSVFAPVLAGTRVLLAEVQALAVAGFLGAAKRRAGGVDPARLAMLIAVLEKHAGLRLADQDIYASVLGGLRVVEPAADLPIALAVAGAFHERALGATAAAVGELALSGEIRAVRQVEQRAHAALRRGARTLVVPAAQVAAVAGIARAAGAEVLPVAHIGQAVDLLG